MALDFPIASGSGQTYQSGDNIWIWDGTKWNKQTPGLNSFITTGSTAPLAYQAITGALFLSDIYATGSLWGTSSWALSSSQAITASYVNILPGPGIRAVTNDKSNNSFTITASVLTVNGVNPDLGGNIAIGLSAVYVGDSGSFQVSQSLGSFTGSLQPGTIWVFANSTGSASGSNGEAFIYTTGSAGSGSWYPLGSSDLAQYDARYLMLAGTNSPMQGPVNWGGYAIHNLANPTSSGDAVNLGTLTASLASYVLTASFDTWTGSNASYFFGTSSNADTSSVAITASFAVTASYIDTASWSVSSSQALTASYVNITGSGVLVNYGTDGVIQLTGSNETVGNYFSPLIEVGPVAAAQSASGNWRMIPSGPNLNFEYWDTGSSTWVLDTYFAPTGNPVSGSVYSLDAYLLTSSFNGWTGSKASQFAGTSSFALTASFVATASVALTAVTASFTVTAATASFVSGAVLNIPDPYTTPVVRTIVSLTSAEYAAIGSPDANTLYVIV